MKCPRCDDVYETTDTRLALCETCTAMMTATFTDAVSEAVEEHLRSGRAEPVFSDGMMVGIRPRGSKVPGRLCGKYIGDNDATCPQLTCVRVEHHEGLCDNTRGDDE